MTKGEDVVVGETLTYRVGRIVCWVTLVRPFSSCRFDPRTGNIETYEVDAKCKAIVKRLKAGRR